MKAVSLAQYWAFFLIVTVGCLVDLLTKHWVFRRLGYGPGSSPYWLWPNHVGFQTSLNEGALFGIGQGQIVLFSTLSALALVGIVMWLFIAKAATDWLLNIALAAVAAGILGNLYDRLGLHGLTWSYPPSRVGNTVYAVRDWILLQANYELRWPNFNVADSLLVCGAAILLWHSFHTSTVAEGKTPRKPPPS